MRVPRRIVARHGVVCFLLALGHAGTTCAQAERDRIVDRPTIARVSAERLKLPADESLGLVGASYLLQITPGFYGGPAVYGTVSGRRGGLHAIGAELASQLPVAERFALGAGVFAGGVGGGGAAVGAGLMLRPHAELLWAYKPGQQIGLGWSQVRFANSVDSRQLAVIWQTTTDFRSVPQGGTLKFENLGTDATPRTGLGFDRVQALAGVYRPDDGARRTSTNSGGGTLPRNLGFAGARLERSLTDNLYWGLEANAAATGGVAGYAEFLGTMGVEATVNEQLSFGYRLALGSAGGGEVDTGGGLLWKAGLYGIGRLASDLGLTAEFGIARAPQGSFRARYASLALTWILDDRYDGTAPPRVTPTEWIAGLNHYRAQRKDGSERSVEMARLRVNREMAPGVYLGAELQGAVGGNVGGYSVGLLGLGLRHELGERWQAGIEAMGGAAGGGGVDTAGGAVVQPMAWLGYRVTPALSLRLGGGYVKSLRGPLSSGVIDVSLSYGFGVASRGYR